MDTDALRALRRAKDRIDRDYSGALGIDVLAAEAGYSPGHFIRAFRAAYGEKPGHYRTSRRIERACELLHAVNLDVTEVCRLVGFTSLGTFSLRFSSGWAAHLPPYRARGGPSGGTGAHPRVFRPHVVDRAACRGGWCRPRLGA